MYEYKAKVVKWIDGDTVDLIVDKGFFEFREGRFRLAAVDTPERGEPGWAEASVHCASRAPAGSYVYIQSQKTARPISPDKYGRFLIYIYPWVDGPLQNPQGHSINSSLIDNKLAKLYL